MKLRHLAEVRLAGDARWFQRALDSLSALPNDHEPRLRDFFSSSAPIFVARAPGRLDIMGGIADYSGSLVLELPLECSTTAILQAQSAPLCEIASRRDGRWDFFTVELPPLVIDEGALNSATALAAWFRRRDADQWASYIVGVAHA